MYTLTTYYLAQVYGMVPSKSTEAAGYVQETLERQLHQVFNAEEWVKNAIDLSAFFQRLELLDAVSHCLSACEVIMDMKDTKAVLDEDNYNFLQAKLNRAWGEFHKHLLKTARDIQLGQSTKSDQFDGLLDDGVVDLAGRRFTTLKFKDRSYPKSEVH